MTLSSTARPSPDRLRRRPVVRTATVGATVAVAAALLTSGGTALAAGTSPVTGRVQAAGDVQAAALPVGVASVKGLGLPDPVMDLVVADGKLWVSSGNQVDVYTTVGKKLTTITGLLGADGLLPSSDGTSVYVAVSQDARIATLSTSTLTQTASWTTGACPTSLALTAGRLFYSYGCTMSDGAIGSFDPSDGSAGPNRIEDYFYKAPDLSGGGTTLVADDQAGSPATLHSYVADSGGNLELRATARITDGDFTVSPDGTQMVIAGSEISRLNTADLSVAGTFATGNWSSAVAYSPDGSTFAGLIAGTGTDLARVYHSTSGALTSHSAPAADGQSLNVRSGTMAFSADGRTVYGIATPLGGTGSTSLITATAQSVARGKVSLSVTSPKRYGQKATVKVTSAAAKTRVTVDVTANNVTKHVSRTTTAKGAVSIPIGVKYSGKVTVTAAGSLRRSTAVSSARSFHVPAKLGLKLVGSYATRGGAQRFHSSAEVKALIVVAPDRYLTAYYQLQARRSGRWVDVLAATYSSSGSSTDYLYVKSARSGVKFRFVGTFSGDTYNSKAPKAYSPSFVID